MVNIDPNDTSYDLAELRIGDEVIVSEDFSYELESDDDTQTATNSRDPIRYKGGGRSYSWEANGVYPEHREFLEEVWKNHTNFSVTAYTFSDTDLDYKEEVALLNARITNISPQHDDEGTTIDISGIALSMK